MAKSDPPRSVRRSFRSGARAAHFDVPAGLTDPALIPASGDQGTDRMLRFWRANSPFAPQTVLIPDRSSDPTVLLTQRSAISTTMPSDFVSGRQDRRGGCLLPLDAALREAEEEWPYPPIRRSDRLIWICTGPARLSHPADVARSGPASNCAFNPAEVDYAFEVPLAFLMDPVKPSAPQQGFRGMERIYYAMPYGERYIWGATAGILRVLYQRIFAS